MLSNVTYAAIKVNPKAGAMVCHSNGFIQAVVIPNQEIVFIKPALEEGLVYGFSAKLSKLGGYSKLPDGRIQYNLPVEIKIPVCDDLAEQVEKVREAWYEARERIMQLTGKNLAK